MMANSAGEAKEESVSEETDEGDRLGSAEGSCNLHAAGEGKGGELGEGPGAEDGERGVEGLGERLVRMGAGQSLASVLNDPAMERIGGVEHSLMVNQPAATSMWTEMWWRQAGKARKGPGEEEQQGSEGGGLSSGGAEESQGLARFLEARGEQAGISGRQGGEGDLEGLDVPGVFFSEGFGLREAMRQDEGRASQWADEVEQALLREVQARAGELPKAVEGVRLGAEGASELATLAKEARGKVASARAGLEEQRSRANQHSLRSKNCRAALAASEELLSACELNEAAGGLASAGRLGDALDAASEAERTLDGASLQGLRWREAMRARAREAANTAASSAVELLATRASQPSEEGVTIAACASREALAWLNDEGNDTGEGSDGDEEHGDDEAEEARRVVEAEGRGEEARERARELLLRRVEEAWQAFMEGPGQGLLSPAPEECQYSHLTAAVRGLGRAFAKEATRASSRAGRAFPGREGAGREAARSVAEAAQGKLASLIASRESPGDAHQAGEIAREAKLFAEACEREGGKGARCRALRRAVAHHAKACLERVQNELGESVKSLARNETWSLEHPEGKPRSAAECERALQSCAELGVGAPEAAPEAAERGAAIARAWAEAAREASSRAAKEGEGSRRAAGAAAGAGALEAAARRAKAELAGAAEARARPAVGMPLDRAAEELAAVERDAWGALGAVARARARRAAERGGGIPEAPAELAAGLGREAGTLARAAAPAVRRSERERALAVVCAGMDEEAAGALEGSGLGESARAAAAIIAAELPEQLGLPPARGGRPWCPRLATLAGNS